MKILCGHGPSRFEMQLSHVKINVNTYPNLSYSHSEERKKMNNWRFSYLLVLYFSDAFFCDVASLFGYKGSQI